MTKTRIWNVYFEDYLTDIPMRV